MKPRDLVHVFTEKAAEQPMLVTNYLKSNFHYVWIRKLKLFYPFFGLWFCQTV